MIVLAGVDHNIPVRAGRRFTELLTEFSTASTAGHPPLDEPPPSGIWDVTANSSRRGILTGIDA
jgi:hypothetical protein